MLFRQSYLCSLDSIIIALNLPAMPRKNKKMSTKLRVCLYNTYIYVSQRNVWNRHLAISHLTEDIEIQKNYHTASKSIFEFPHIKYCRHQDELFYWDYKITGKNLKECAFSTCISFYIKNNPTRLFAMQWIIKPINKFKIYLWKIVRSVKKPCVMFMSVKFIRGVLI